MEDLQKATQTIQTQAAAAAEEALAAQKHVEEMEMQQKAQLGKVQWEQDGFSCVLLGTSGKSKRLYRPAKGIRLLAQEILPNWCLPLSLMGRKGWAIYLEVRVLSRADCNIRMVFKGLCWQNQYGYLSDICYCNLGEGTIAIHLFTLLGEVCQRQQ